LAVAGRGAPAADMAAAAARRARAVTDRAVPARPVRELAMRIARTLTRPVHRAVGAEPHGRGLAGCAGGRPAVARSALAAARAGDFVRATGDAAPVGPGSARSAHAALIVAVDDLAWPASIVGVQRARSRDRSE